MVDRGEIIGLDNLGEEMVDLGDDVKLGLELDERGDDVLEDIDEGDLETE